MYAWAWQVERGPLPLLSQPLVNKQNQRLCNPKYLNELRSVIFPRVVFSGQRKGFGEEKRNCLYAMSC